MAWTQTDLDVIEAAVASGELSITFSDGRSVTYRSISELLLARDLIKGTLATPGSRSTLATFRKD